MDENPSLAAHSKIPPTFAMGLEHSSLTLHKNNLQGPVAGGRKILVGRSGVKLTNLRATLDQDRR